MRSRDLVREARASVSRLRGMQILGEEEEREVRDMLLVLSTLKRPSQDRRAKVAVGAVEHDPRCNGNCSVGLLGRCVYEAPRVEAEAVDTFWRDSEMKKKIDRSFLKQAGIETPSVADMGTADKCYLADLAVAYGEASRRCSELGNELERAEDDADKAVGRRNHLRQEREATRTLMEKAKNALLVAAEKAVGCP